MIIPDVNFLTLIKTWQMCFKYFEVKYYMIRYVWCVLKVECSEQLWDHEGPLYLKL